MKPKWFLVTALAAVLSMTGSTADVPQQSGLSMYIARMVGTALPYREETRWEAYRTITRIANVLYGEDRFGAEIATLTTHSFDGFPLLALTDKDGDRRADFFAYHETDDRETTLEFGVFFTTGDDPTPAWVVFNNGTVPEAFSADIDDWVLFWATHHFVDRNGDGRFDLYIGNGTDPDGDGKTGVHETEWAYDDDFDGGLDRAEVIISGEVRDLNPEDGMFPFAGLGPVEIGAPTCALGDAIAADILKALEGVAR